MAGDTDFTKKLNKTQDIEKLRQAIALEITKMKAEAEARGEGLDFNNLWQKLPDQTGVSPLYKRLEESGRLDRPMATPGSQGSEFSLQINYRRFYELLGEVLKKLSLEGKINIEEIKELVSKVFVKYGSTASKEAKRKLQVILEPIYTEMRILGFSHYDLWK